MTRKIVQEDRFVGWRKRYGRLILLVPCMYHVVTLSSVVSSDS
jgi:hypothetical protein